MTPTRIFAVWDDGTSRDLIGFLLLAADPNSLIESDEVVLGIEMHLDDAELRTPAHFWSYVNAVLPQCTKVSVEEL